MTTTSTAVFVYGTLVDGERLEAVAGRRFASAPAVLEGYTRVSSPDTYPYVVPHAGGRVDGLLLFGIDPTALERLDHYEREGQLYFRRPATVRCRGAEMSCQVYVGNAAVLDPRAGG